MPRSTGKEPQVTYKHLKHLPVVVIEKFTRAYDNNELTIEFATQTMIEHGFNTYSIKNDFVGVLDPRRLRDWMNVALKVVHDVKTERDKRKLRRISDVLTMVRAEMKEALEDRNLNKYKTLCSKYNRLQDIVSKIVATGTVI
jgi:hypothetical protein